MSIPLGQMDYQPCGDLWFDFHGLDPVSNYRRWLDLDTATQTTEYESDGVKFRREVIISHPDRALFLRITADKPGKINGRVRLTSPHQDSTTTSGNASSSPGTSNSSGKKPIRSSETPPSSSPPI